MIRAGAMDGEEPPDEVPLELRLWIDEELSEEDRAALAGRSPFGISDIDEEKKAPHSAAAFLRARPTGHSAVPRKRSLLPC